jgi:hypothetical protein
MRVIYSWIDLCISMLKKKTTTICVGQPFWKVDNFFLSFRIGQQLNIQNIQMADGTFSNITGQLVPQIWILLFRSKIHICWTSCPLIFENIPSANWIFWIFSCCPTLKEWKKLSTFHKGCPTHIVVVLFF